MTLTFQEKMNQIMTHWEGNPIAPEFAEKEDIKLMCTVEGIQQQLDKLAQGPGNIMVATADDNNPTSIKIQTLSVFKE
jgi:hypothetical protein